MRLSLEKEKFDNRFVMAAYNYYNICKTFNGTATYIEIINVGNELIFQGQNENGKITKKYKDTSGNQAQALEDTKKSKKKVKKKIIQGVYELKNLMHFSKANKICDNIDIWIKDSYPLLLGVPIGTMGKMYVFLQPVDSTPNNNPN